MHTHVDQGKGNRMANSVLGIKTEQVWKPAPSGGIFCMCYYQFIICCVGIGLVRIPTLSKAPLDLFKAYIAVQNLGGFINVSYSGCFVCDNSKSTRYEGYM